MKSFKRFLVVGTIVTVMMAAIFALTGAANAVNATVPDMAAPATDANAPGSYLTGANEGAPLDIALDYIGQNAADLGLTTADISDMIVTDLYKSEHNGVTHIYFQQQLNGIRVFNAIININIAADGSVINLGSRFVPDLANSVVSNDVNLAPGDAVVAAANELGLSLATSPQVLEVVGGPSEKVILDGSGISVDAIPVELMYQLAQDGGVYLSWDLVINEFSGEHWWSIRVDASDGRILSEFDWVIHENAGHEEDHAGSSVSNGSGQSSQNLLWSKAGQAANNPDEYFVFAYPKEDPGDGAPTLEVDPADATSNPFGWHDTNGASGPEYTITRGNNVWADSDLDANNIMDGNAPDGGASLIFNEPYDLNLDPSEYLTASIINLFYWNNLMHDITYRYGFDEAAGNFQENNYGNGGSGSDSVDAQAQDGSGTNNANFATPPDGSNPRMQMYRTTYPFGQAVTVTAPITLSDVYTANPSNNGGTANGLTADVELVVDGTAPTNDACQTVTNDLTGKIALILWSGPTCNSSVFVQNAADAGAIAAIIIDDTDLPLSNFGGSASIPSVAIGLSDGQAFMTALNNHTVTATIGDNPIPGVDRDTDLDNGVIAHEYGHGVSNRLTGGPSTASCLGNQEQMGEGWSDLQTLFIHAAPGDMATDAREIGVWSLGAGYQGIRNFPYSTDLGVNPQTYNDIATTNLPHGLGEIWASMVWEVYWNLVDKHGFNPNIYDDWTTGGNNLTFQLMMDGMKLQPCSPGFVDGRDAILAADMALTGGSNQCEIWSGFAKRGLGFSASQGSSGSVTDGTEAYDLPAACAFISAQPIEQNVCAGNTVDYIVDIGPLFTSPPVTMSSSGEPAGTTTNFNPNPVNSVPMSTTMSVATTGATPGGTYGITITGTDAITSASFDVSLTVFDGSPGAPTLTSPVDGGSDVEYQPSFQWTAVAEATGYTIEIADDAAFTNIIETATVVDPFYDMVGVLDSATTYYWRVSAENLCGGAASSEFSFTTVAEMCDPGTYTRITYFEDFEAGEGGWTHSATLSDTWQLSNSNPSPGSGGFAFYAEDLGVPEDQMLFSPPIDLPTGDANLTLQFMNEQNFEDPAGSGGCWDGGHLEITTDGGTNWTPLDTELMSDPYDGVGDNGPPTGLNMWCGTVSGNQPWLNSVVNLDAYAGETVQFRYQMLSDAAVGAEGWYVDDVKVQSCSANPTDVSLTEFGPDEQQGSLLAMAAALFAVVAGLGVLFVRRTRISG